MIYRTAAIFIVLFWLAMTGLLVHRQIFPDDSAMREIPVSQVVKLFFVHHMHRLEADPPLSIYHDKLRIGDLKLIPQVDEQTHDHNLEFHGNLQVSVFGGKRDRVALNGFLNMEQKDKELTTKQFQLEITTHSPIEQTTKLVILPQQNLAHYELHTAWGTVEQKDYTLDEAGAREALRQAEIDPALIPTFFKPQAAAEAMAAVSIKAQLSSLTIHGAEMDTFLVTIKSNDQTLLECHVDQLGRVVYVSSNMFGYTLTPMNDITP